MAIHWSNSESLSMVSLGGRGGGAFTSCSFYLKVNTALLFCTLRGCLACWLVRVLVNRIPFLQVSELKGLENSKRL